MHQSGMTKVWSLWGQKQRQPRAVVMTMSASCCNQTSALIRIGATGSTAASYGRGIVGCRLEALV